MNKKAKMLVVSGLAIVGAVSVYMWFRKPRKNDDNFYNVSGKKSGNCAWCRDAQGNTYRAMDRNCNMGDRCVTQYS